ncbi:carbohydrate sulfotransferase 1-like [Mytilus galloprovincialis]|uniref:carbohydrate sulfotransferase 1-like n=1 Tax=Mytilus galloprovincialis TaxID=29158 RepID=UPI003F7B98E4
MREQIFLKESYMEMGLRFAILLLVLMSVVFTGILYMKSQEIDITRQLKNTTAKPLQERKLRYLDSTTVRCDCGQHNINTTTPAINETRPSPVIILTYARSGSSFLGDIIRQTEEVFYVFEPLHFLRNSHRSMTFLNGTKRNSYQYLTEASNVINSFITCQLINLPLEFWNAGFEDMHGYQLQTFFTKFKSERLVRYLKRMEFQLAVEKLQLECLKSKVVAIKTIRVPLFIVQGLFSQLKKLKILHLVRDPRPTIISQKKHIREIDSVSDYAANLCFRISNDILMSNLLTVFYPLSIVRIRYEILTTNPIDMSKGIYQFLNLTFTDEIQNVILMKTSSGKSGKGPLNTVKGNSTEMVNKWRYSANYSFVKSIDKQCQYLYKKLGYIQINNTAMLQNTSIPLFHRINPGGNGRISGYGPLRTIVGAPMFQDFHHKTSELTV